MAHVSSLLAGRHIAIELTAAARQLLFREGYDPAYGARPMKRAIQRLIQNPLAMRILEGKLVPGEHVVVDAEPKVGRMRFEHGKPLAA